MIADNPRPPAVATGARWFDSHAHVDHLDDAAAEQMCERAAAAGVVAILAVGGTPAMNAAALRLAARRPAQVAAAVGWDRSLAGAAPSLAELRDTARRPEVVAVGETGLDYHYGRETAGAQRRLFEEVLALAAVVGKPVVVHSREAEEDTLAMLRQHGEGWRGAPGRLGVIHCFTGDWPFARALLDLGWHISFSGIVTFRHAHDLREIAAKVPEDRLLIETDSPWLSPEPRRGRPNEPARVVDVGGVVAAARGLAPAALAELTWRNAARLFGWPPASGG
ncbi:MAG: TatD family hydrolase [Kiritimatiellae bacterium]|nr:TatD family hydrolase [Kiritimatiellia bacterium]